MDSDDHRDVALIARIRHGEQEALDVLLRTYWVRLIRYARGFVGSLDAAQDVVQDVFLRVWRHRAALEISAGVAPYLYRMTRNEAMTSLQASQTNAERDGRWIQAMATESRVPQNDGERTLELDDVRTRLLQALDGLPPRCQEIFMLSWEHNLSYAQIAASFGISVLTVRNQMSRAVTHLAGTLRLPTKPRDSGRM